MSRKPSPEEDDLQPLAAEAPGLVRDITGEVHAVPEPMDEDGSGIQIYVVRRGDTLGRIAKHFYGDANQYERIIAVNRDRLGDSDEPIVGSQLRIPPAG